MSRCLAVGSVAAVFLTCAAAEPASASVSAPATKSRVSEIDSAILSWSQSQFKGNGGYPSSWTESVHCHVPSKLKTGTKFECDLLFDEPGHTPLLNEGYLNVKLTKVAKRESGYSIHTKVSSYVFHPYSPQDFTTTTTTPPAGTASSTTTTTTATTTPLPPAGTCRGTWSYSNGTVSATVVTRGPAKVSVTATDSQANVVSTTSTVIAGSSTATVSMVLSPPPVSVMATAVELGSDGSPSGGRAGCTLAHA
jgi:hypothetical protein